MFKPAETLRNALICSVWLCWGLTFDTSTCAQEQTLGMFTVRHMHSHTSIDHVSALNVPDWDLIIVDMPQIALQGYIHRNVTKGWTDQRHTAELEPSLLEITGTAKYVLCLAVPVVVLLSPTKWACQCHVTVASWKKTKRECLEIELDVKKCAELKDSMTKTLSHSQVLWQEMFTWTRTCVRPLTVHPHGKRFKPSFSKTAILISSAVCIALCVRYCGWVLTAGKTRMTRMSCGAWTHPVWIQTEQRGV